MIEVKSTLTKHELYDSLNKIEKFRQMVTNKCLDMPFGIILAYKLKDNSLNSLKRNLRDYQQIKPVWCRPNLVVVLEEGIIFQGYQGYKSQPILKVEDFEAKNIPIGISYKKDTLFEFYTALFSILSAMRLGNLDIGNYRDLPSQVGEFIVRNHIFITKGNKIYTLSESFINKVYEYCQKKGKKTLEEILLLSKPAIEYAFWDKEQLLSKNYYYDPENLPGTHQVKEPYRFNEQGRPVLHPRMNIPCHYVEIDGEVYYYPEAYVLDDETNNLTELEIES
jgi:hypothetical protein